MRYYKCSLCGFEFCRTGKIVTCPFCEKDKGLRRLTAEEKEKFITKHMANRKE